MLKFPMVKKQHAAIVRCVVEIAHEIHFTRWRELAGDGWRLVSSSSPGVEGGPREPGQPLENVEDLDQVTTARRLASAPRARRRRGIAGLHERGEGVFGRPAVDAAPFGLFGIKIQHSLNDHVSAAFETIHRLSSRRERSQCYCAVVLLPSGIGCAMVATAWSMPARNQSVSAG